MRTSLLAALATFWWAPLCGTAQVEVAQIPVTPTVSQQGPERHIQRISGEVALALELEDRDEAKARLTRASDEARELARAFPEHADAQALLAAASGSLMEYHGPKTKIRLANEVLEAAEATLRLDPDHPGAHHVMGRLHAGGMRASRFVKVVAKLFFGAEIFDDISWETAEEHFTRALELEPDSPRHAMELGALYMDTDRPQEAERVLRRAVQCTGRAAGDSLAIERAHLLLETLDRARS